MQKADQQSDRDNNTRGSGRGLSKSPSNISTTGLGMDIKNSANDLIRAGISTSQIQFSKIQLKKEVDSDSSSTSVGSAGSGSIARPNLKRKLVKSRNKCQLAKRAILGFWIRFSCMFLSRMFLRHRNLIFLVIEILMPVAITAGVLASVTTGATWKRAYYEKDAKDSTPQSVTFKEMDMSTVMAKFKGRYTARNGRMMILYSPANNLTNAIMNNVMDVLGIRTSNQLYTNGGDEPETTSGVLGFKSELELIAKALIHRDEKNKKHGKPIGVVFKDKPVDPITHCPPTMSFFIRHFEESISQTEKPYPYVKPDRSHTSTSAYIKTGFLGLQFAVQQAYINYLKNEVPINPEFPYGVQVKVQQYYFPNFYNDEVRTMITFTTCMCLVTGYLFTSFFILKQLVDERKSGIKELLMMHGMPKYLHWLILFFHALLFRGITAALITIVLISNLGNGMIITLADRSLIFAIIWVHLLALTFFNFFLSSVVGLGSFIGSYATIIGLLSFLGPVTLYKMNIIERVGNFILSIFLPNWALFNVFHHVINFEYDDKKVSWNNIKVRTNAGDKNSLTISEGLIVMGSSAIFYLALATYFDLFGETKLYSRSLHWWDFCGKWKERKENRMRQQEMLDDIKAGNKYNFEKPAIFELPVSKKKCYVRARNLCKRYGKHKMALDTVNLDIYHEEITVILGHGGSGKSTLISTLAGMISPTAGYATVKNKDVIYDSSKVRRMMGLCTQTLVYYNLLSVKEHLHLCYRLRGYVAADCTRNTSTLLTRLRLWNIRNSYPDSMAKDELRRLNIAMALTDSPKVLLIDEPTTFCDAFGRREIWSILKLLKRHHTIIVATNYMDEAECLADKVALLSHGRLICYGSLEFLRKQYDTGYFLKCQPFPDRKLDSKIILALIKSCVGDNAVEQKNSSIKEVDNIIIELPIVDYLKFAELCQEFEQNQMKLGIKKYSFKQIGLNDIFIKICESISTYSDAPDLYVRRDSAGDIRSALTTQIPTIPESGRYVPNCKSQLSALLKKRFTYLLSQRGYLAWQLLIPILLILLVMLATKVFVANPTDPTPRNMTFKGFLKIKVLTRMDANNPYINKTKISLGSAYTEPSTGMEILHALRTLIQGKGNNLGTIKESHMAALEVKSSHSSSYEFTGYYASGALHSAPIILSEIMNILISTVTGNSHCQLFAVNNPMPFTTASWSGSYKSCGHVCTSLAFLISFALGFISASSTIFPMQERRLGIKHIQLMAVPAWMYWLGNFVGDAILMLGTSVVIGIIFSIEGNDAIGTNAIFVLIGLTALYLGWSGLAFSYFASFHIPLRFRSFSFMVVLHLISLLLFMLVEFIIKKFDTVGSVLRIVFMIFPGFAVTCGIQDWFIAISRRSLCKGLHPHVKDACKTGHNENTFPTLKHFNGTLYDHVMKTDVRLGQCCDKICKPSGSCFVEPKMLDRVFENETHPGLITDMIALTLTGLLYWILLLLAERKITNRISQKVVAQYLDSEHGKKLSKTPPPSIEVNTENKIVQAIVKADIIPEDTAMVVSNLTKCRAARIIINNFNLRIKKGDCVGILGAGGSGKTSLVRMMVGIDTPTKGMCFIQDSHLFKHRKKYLASIGYCPENNALFDKFSGIQMLELMGRLRGIPKEILSSHVAKWLQVCGLGDCGQDKCVEYGLDMKRRLCCAMALIGQCPILVLDEATTGVGPLGRERLWAILEHLKGLGHTIIFTTFHTEECVNLSTKLVVLADGNAQSLGKPEDLRQRFAKGYCLTFRMKQETLTRHDMSSTTMGRIVDFKKAVQNTFSFCDILDEQDNLLMYFLQDKEILWGEVFSRMHSLVSDYDFMLSSYDVSEASIDELFILLTSKYREIGNPRQIDEKIAKEMLKEDAENRALKAAARALHMKI